MKPLRIQIGALHRNRLPLLLSPQSSPSTLPASSQHREVSRPHLIGTAAVAGVGLFPAVKMVETVPASAGEAFEMTITKTRVAFSQNRKGQMNASKKAPRSLNLFWFLYDRLIEYSPILRLQAGA